MSDWRQARTARLWLDEPVEGDADALFAIHSDPASWRHFPSGLVTDPAAGATMVGASRRRFERDGLAYWSVRDVDGGPAVGRGGCMVPDEARGEDGGGRGWWNLYYRFDQRVLGRGYAAEMGRAALDAAHDVAPERPSWPSCSSTTSRRGGRRRRSACAWSGAGPTTATPTPTPYAWCSSTGSRTTCSWPRWPPRGGPRSGSSADLPATARRTRVGRV